MDDKHLSDNDIGRLVRSLELDIPPDMDDRIRMAASGLRPRPVSGRRLFWLLTLPSAAAALVVAALLFLPSRPNPVTQENPVISEIRTDFEIPDKNIRIIFIQRPDFKLFEED